MRYSVVVLLACLPHVVAFVPRFSGQDSILSNRQQIRQNKLLATVETKDEQEGERVDRELQRHSFESLMSASFQENNGSAEATEDDEIEEEEKTEQMIYDEVNMAFAVEEALKR